MKKLSLSKTILVTLAYRYKATWIPRSSRTGSILLTKPYYLSPYPVLESRIISISSWRKFLNKTKREVENED